MDGTSRLLGWIRATGLGVVFMSAFGARPQPAAGSYCKDFTIDECTPNWICEKLAGDSCGSQVPGCGGQGWIACGYSNCDYPELTMICQFE